MVGRRLTATKSLFTVSLVEVLALLWLMRQWEVSIPNLLLYSL